MRRVLIDHARRRGAVKRGGRVALLPLDTVAERVDTQDPEAVMAFDEAFALLAASHPQAAELIRLRFFAGLSETETARLIGMSERSLRRQWRLARVLRLENLSEKVTLG